MSLEHSPIRGKVQRARAPLDSNALPLALSYAEVARLLSCSKRHVIDLANAGIIQRTKALGEKCPRIVTQSMLRLLEEREEG